MGPASSGLVAAFLATTRSTRWEPLARIPLRFPAFHPQGMAMVSGRVVLSSVDRAGAGHLFVVDRSGRLLGHRQIGHGPHHHPGGIDFDGRWVWVPVAEYRRGGTTIVYRVDPITLRATEVFRANDHLGALAVDRNRREVHGLSWGSRRFSRWSWAGRPLGTVANPSHLVDHQDVTWVGEAGLALCSGVIELPGVDGRPFELGGLTLVELTTGRIHHEIPVAAYSSAGHVLTRNPVHLERDGSALRLWAAPDDGHEQAGTELLVHEAALPVAASVAA